ncbi:unnamed protein product [Linum trigynum]|uniref:Integrase catalytic domain-containing protein n=1 Tax=Linum trigynum TaxID=586398 RepID=A0AAV2DP44_9ROSI
MAKDDDVKSEAEMPLLEDVIGPTSPLYLHPSDALSQVFVGDLLTDMNYGEWSAEISNALVAKNKLGFVLGTIPRPKSGELLDAWTRCNAMVVGWLRSAMTRELRSSLSSGFTSKQIWDELKERFSTGSLPRRYKIRREIMGLRQDRSSVSSFYAKLQRLWDDWLTLDPPAACTCGKCECRVEERTRSSHEAMRLLDFLVGLDDGFSTVRTHLLSLKPIPSLGEAYHAVANDEQQRSLSSDLRPRTEAAAFQGKGEKQQLNGERTPEGRPFCTHCEKPGHFKATCYELIGWPARSGDKAEKGERPRRRNSNKNPRSDPRPDPQAAAVEKALSTPIPGLTPSQVDQLRAFLSSSSTPTSNLAGKNLSFQDTWIIDSGCTEHIAKDKSLFDGELEPHPSLQVTIPNGKGVPVRGIGTTRLANGLVLRRVLYVPDFQCNLLSVSRLTADHSVAVVFMSNFCVIQDLHSKRMIGTGRHVDGLYYLRVFDGEHPVAFNARKAVRDTSLWHMRLGHPSLAKLMALQPHISSILVSHKDPCPSCLQAKQTRLPVMSSSIKTQSCFELIHVDIWGGYKQASFSGAHYFLTIVDDYSRTVWVYLLKYKSEVARYLLMFFNQVRTQYAGRVKRVQTDNGREFGVPALQDYYEQEGIILQTSCTDTPQQNGVVERKHRHLLNTARALRFHSGLPTRFWGECVLTTAYLINRLPLTSIQNRTPYDVLFGKPPQFEHLRSFGCLLYAKDTHPHLSKFAPRGQAGIFVGYPSPQRSYKVYDLETHQINTSRDVFFLEHVFPFQKDIVHLSCPDPALTQDATIDDHPLGGHSPAILAPGQPTPSSIPNEATSSHAQQQVDVLPTPNSDPSADSPQQIEPVLPSVPSSSTDHLSGDATLASSSSSTSSLEPVLTSSPDATTSPMAPPHSPAADLPRRGNRVPRPSVHLDGYEVQVPGRANSSHVKYPLEEHVGYDRLSPAHKIFVAAVSNIFEPRHFHQAVRIKEWRAAMRAEVEALVANGTWTLTTLPPGKRAIACKWVYKVKYLPDGTVERFKARLVAKGFTQVEGIDYHDTFAPVAKLVTVRCLLSVAVSKGWIIHQLDVNNAFLHGDLSEEVYMEIPQGFAKAGETRVCRLHKSLYGLKQASQNWYHKFSAALLSLGFVQSHADHSLFIRKTSTSFVAALIYVDDVILTGDDSTFIQAVKDFLHQQFTIKDLGPLKYFLGIEVARSKRGMVLNQRKYVLDILSDCGIEAGRPVATPIEQNHQLGRLPSAPAQDPSGYRRLVGRLLYLTVTRPDIQYAVNLLSQGVHSPTQAHVDLATRVLRYLKQSPGNGLFLPAQSSLTLTAYCDADWGGCPTTRRSTTGYFIRLGRAPVSWRTKKQTVVACSSVEAEYRAMATTVSELIWLRWLLSDLGCPQPAATPLHCDSQAALHISANPVFHERTKHVEMDCHFVRECVQSSDIAPCKIAISEQPADLLTKGLGHDQFHHLLSKLGMLDIHAFA